MAVYACGTLSYIYIYGLPTSLGQTAEGRIHLPLIPRPNSGGGAGRAGQMMGRGGGAPYKNAERVIIMQCSEGRGGLFVSDTKPAAARFFNEAIEAISLFGRFAMSARGSN